MSLPLTTFNFFYHIKQIDSMLPWVCTITDNIRCQTVVRTSALRLHLVCHFFVLTTIWRHLWSINENRHGNMEYIYLFYGSRKGLKRITLGSSHNYLTVSNPHWKQSSFRIRINFKNQGHHLIYKYKYGKKTSLSAPEMRTLLISQTW